MNDNPFVKCFLLHTCTSCKQPVHNRMAPNRGRKGTIENTTTLGRRFRTPNPCHPKSLETRLLIAYQHPKWLTQQPSRRALSPPEFA